MPAAIDATKEIGLAVLATTLSLMAVFLPVAFMGGIVGRFLSSFGLTMAFAIAVSLFVSFTLTPMLASRWLQPDRAPAAEPQEVAARARGRRVLPPDRARLHARARASSMRHRWVVVLAALARAVVSIVPLVQGGAQGLPARERRGAVRDQRAHARGDQPGGDAARSRERIAREVRAAGREVDATLVTIGDNDAEDAEPGARSTSSLVPPERAQADAGSSCMDRVRREIVAKQPKELRASASRGVARSAAAAQHGDRAVHR